MTCCNRKAFTFGDEKWSTSYTKSSSVALTASDVFKGNFRMISFLVLHFIMVSRTGYPWVFLPIKVSLSQWQNSLLRLASSYRSMVSRVATKQHSLIHIIIRFLTHAISALSKNPPCLTSPLTEFSECFFCCIRWTT